MKNVLRLLCSNNVKYYIWFTVLQTCNNVIWFTGIYSPLLDTVHVPAFVRSDRTHLYCMYVEQQDCVGVHFFPFSRGCTTTLVGNQQ